LFTLDVDGEQFAIGQAGDGGTTYDWLSRAQGRRYEATLREA
jgi:hypothetical protein